MNAIFQCLAKGASSLRSSPQYLVMKEGRNLQGAGVGTAKVTIQCRMKGGISSASKTCCQS